MPTGRSRGEAGKILIVGGGPTGLGAAWRLHELGYSDWELIERDTSVGGLAASRVDDQGFTWDFGGHVVFSHYPYFDRVLDAVGGDDWIEHVREAWVWMCDGFIPYPLQNNIHRLPPEVLIECLDGLVEALAEGPQRAPATFADWIASRFGSGLARVFMHPYNRKVWACEPSAMSARWVGERVATVDLKRILRNLVLQRDDRGWGPNATFRFPGIGGTGHIWNAIARMLPAERLRLGTVAERIDGAGRTLFLETGESIRYDWLLTTMPLNVLPGRVDDLGGLQNLTSAFRYSGTHVVGVGLDGAVPEALATKCWIYFPEPELPFYRVTVFSNYSPHNVPRPGRQWSLIAEVSESPKRPMDGGEVTARTVAGLRAAGLIGSDAAIRSLWHTHLEYGYPTPFLGRDAVLEKIEPALRARRILSRGRFGAWKYEVANMDHSFMQGVEAVNHILLGEPERTLESPDLVNAVKA